MGEGRKRLLAVIPLAIALAIVPLFGSAYYNNLLINIAIFTIITVGLCLLMGFSGQISLGHAAFYGLGAFVSGILSTRYGWSPWLSMLAAALAAAIVGYVIGRPIFRLKGYYLAMATLGVGMIAYVLFVELKDYTGGPSGLRGIPPLSIGGLALDSDGTFYYLAWAVCLAVLLLADNIVHSRLGRGLRSLHASDEAVESVGVNPSALKVQVFVLSAVLAAVAGALYAHYVGFISPQPFGFMISIKLVVMVVIGGLASVWGALFGAATVVLLSEILQPLGELDFLVFGLVMMLVMMFWPQGLTRAIVDLRKIPAEVARRRALLEGTKWR